MSFEAHHGKTSTYTKDEKKVCRYCNQAGGVQYAIWESSCGGYEDLHYMCTLCKKQWWVDGIDS